MFSICFFFALRKRRPIGDLRSATLFLAREEKLKSGTTLLPHVVTSLQLVLKVHR